MSDPTLTATNKIGEITTTLTSNAVPRMAPLPDDETPGDRDWTDVEWLRNQWWLVIQAMEDKDKQLAEKKAALALCVEYRARVKAAVLAANTVNDEDEEAWKAAIEELYKIQQEADNFYASLPDSAKRGAEILRAARELVAAWDALRKNGNSGTYENNELSNLQDAKAKFRQAVRARNK